jgi:hypothetical protein
MYDSNKRPTISLVEAAAPLPAGDDDTSLVVVPCGDLRIVELMCILQTIQVVRAKAQQSQSNEDFQHLLDTYCLIGTQTQKFIEALEAATETESIERKVA